jgi:hypothetical protein
LRGNHPFLGAGLGTFRQRRTRPLRISSHLPSPRSQIDGEEKPPRRRSTKNLRQAFRYIKLVRERGLIND